MTMRSMRFLRDGARLTAWAKAGLVCAGYLAAFAAAWLASWAYNARMAEMPYDTSGGMYAAGESMAALGTFFVVALPPTLLMLWFLRRNAKLWLAVAVGSLGFAGAGLLAVLMFVAVRDAPGNLVVLLLSLLGLAQLFGVPLWAAAFALFAFLAPTRPARRMLIVATGIELVIGVITAIRWLVAQSPF